MSTDLAARKDRLWFITGASRGLGRALAEVVLEDGDRTVLAVRDPSSVRDLIAVNRGRAEALRLDVANVASIRDAVAHSESSFGPVDILMNNAGYLVVGAVEEVEPEQYRPLFETNFFGAVEVMREFIPRMRSRRSGHILAMSAMGGLISSAGLSYYCATKAALESICEGLAQELLPFGVRVSIIEPGNFRTAVLDRRIVAPENKAYEETAGKLRQRFAETAGKQPGDPILAARACVAITRKQNPPLRLPLGRDAIARIRGKLDQVTQDVAAAEAVAAKTAFAN
jgi:NAD(P)-dependent dehydrogenase (short-subunit alcohol dehydrogenase family)